METDAHRGVLEMLEEDMVYHGFLAQYLEQGKSDNAPLEERIKIMLTELLASGRVEIGVAKLAAPDYVEFVAWNGMVNERVSRALAAVDTADGRDREFAYWLCLRQNVDRFEGNS